MTFSLFKTRFFDKNQTAEDDQTNINCKFHFDFDVIYPGQIITGYIEVSAKQPLIIERIIMEVCGTAECSWTYDKHLVKLPKIYKKGTIFNGNHQFYLSRHTLAGSDMGSVNVGDAEQMFQFRTSLPSYLPATWKGKYGAVKYLTKALIKEENKPLRIFMKEFNVSSKRNLKFEQHLLCEARQDFTRNFRYAIINLGKVYVNVWLPLCGIGAGQGIPVLCTVSNESTIQFGGVIFVLTQLQIYRSLQPIQATKTHRIDICRVPRMVDILQGTHKFYCVLETNSDLYPTNQCWKCNCCQVIYEVWVSLQGSIPRYKAYGYPNINTPGIPVIIGTEPLREWNNQLLTNDVMAAVYDTRPPIIMEPLPPDDDIEEMLNKADEEWDCETEHNLSRQLTYELMFQKHNEDDTGTIEDVKSKDDVERLY